MSESIDRLTSTTFVGRRFTRKRLEEIQAVVNACPHLSRTEIGQTICEHMQWNTPRGTSRIQSCLAALEEMEKAGLFVLPAKDESKKRGPQKEISWPDTTEEQAPVCCPIGQIMPVTVDVVTDEAQKQRNKAFIDRYHYLGYRHPIGPSLQYEIKGGKGVLLGFLLFSYATTSLPCRDQWIGWDKGMRKKRLHLVLNNTRFLLLPWVNVKHLASKVLSMATRQLADDWQTQHGYRPVLIETYVAPRFTGVSYRAANWQRLGETAGVKASAQVKEKIPKAVYVYPLSKDFKSELIEGPKKPLRKQQKQNTSLGMEDPFVQLWGKIIATVVTVANAFDRQWQQRRRTLNTLLLVLFIFRLVIAKNKQGYGTTLVELWEQCRLLNIPLPQRQPVAASAFCNARKKLDETLFKTLNTEIIKAYGTQLENNDWKNHRLFAVDGSKLNLPRQLLQAKYGYRCPSPNAYYPQGLLSCLYRLKPKLPVDFELAAHGDERKLAYLHLPTLKENDVVVYDRGYFSYAMLYFHLARGIYPIFRIKARTYQVIDQFTVSEEREQIVDIFPGKDRRREIQKDYPNMVITPLKLRLLKYTVAGETYALGTTLLDKEIYRLEDFPDVYHARWGVEELYKISKQHIDVEDFHGQSERGVKQELFAHFVLITLTRIFSNHTEIGFNPNNNTGNEKQKVIANFKNSLLTVARNIEALFLRQAALVTKMVNRIVTAISRCKQRRRPNRSYDRASKKPVNKWYPEKGAKTKAKSDVTVVIA